MFSVFLIAVSLGTDAFAVSVTNGLSIKNFLARHALLMALYFSIAQFLMPLIGYLLGSSVSGYVMQYGRYLSVFLLCFVGGRMIYESRRPDDADEAMVTLSHGRLLLLALATSIDALAVGLSFTFMDINLLPACIVIGAVTYVMCFFGALASSKLRWISPEKAEFAGGLVLIGIGLTTLF